MCGLFTTISADIAGLCLTRYLGVEFIVCSSQASTIIDLAIKAGLVDTLTRDGPAFAALPQEIVEAVSTDTDLLKSVLSSQASNNLKLDTDR